MKVYNLEADPTAKVIIYNPTSTILQADGNGGTELGYIDFIGDKNVSMSQIGFERTPTNPSQGDLIPA